MSKIGAAGAVRPTVKVSETKIVRGSVVEKNPTMPQARAARIDNLNLDGKHASPGILSDLGKLTPSLAAGVRRVAGTKATTK